MGWNDLRHLALNASEDDTREVAYRAAARATSRLANNIGPTSASGEAREDALLAIVRGLMAARVALDVPDVESLKAAWAAAAALNRHNNTFSYTARAVKYALHTIMPEAHISKEEGLRRCFQAVSDLEQNVHRAEGDTAALVGAEVWDIASTDFRALARGANLPPVLEADDALSRRWRRFERHLVSFDDTWEIWVLWLRFRIFGLSAEEIPPHAWAPVERRLALQDEAFWERSARVVNASFAEMIIAEVDRLVDEEAARDQSKLGITFYVSDDGRFDVGHDVKQDRSTIIASVLAEVIANTTDLIDACSSNVAARIKSRAESYLTLLGAADWTDDMLLVMRGDALRKEQQFQIDREDDSDIPPLPQSTMRSLEQVVRSHNMLVNAHPALAEIDKMLLGPGSEGGDRPVESLRALVDSAKARDIVSLKAREALEDAADQIAESQKDTSRANRRAQLTGANMIRAAVKFLWQQKGSVAWIGGAASSAYAIGQWAVANQAIIMSYFSGNPVMKLVLKRLYEALLALPLL